MVPGGLQPLKLVWGRLAFLPLGPPSSVLPHPTWSGSELPPPLLPGVQNPFHHISAGLTNAICPRFQLSEVLLG